MRSNIFFSVFIFICCNLNTISGQGYNTLWSDQEPTVTWCTVRPEEYNKCLNFSQAVQRDKNLFGREYIRLNCSMGSNREECMTQVDNFETYVTSLDAGDVFIGGRYYSLVPILQELYPGNRKEYYAVAVVKKNTLKDVTHVKHLRGKKACFTGVGSLAGWVIPISTLMKRGGMDIIDCNNHVKSATMFFGPSCAVNSLHDKYNPIGDNSDKLCSLCTGKVGAGKCTDTDPYADFTGAFRCLLEAGDIAFVRHTTVSTLTDNRLQFPSVSKNDFELLCLDGSRKPIDEFEACNWGSVPSNAVVTSSASTLKTRRLYQKFFQRAVQIYGPERNNTRDSDINRGFEYNSFYTTTDRTGLRDNRFQGSNNRFQGSDNRFQGSDNRFQGGDSNRDGRYQGSDYNRVDGYQGSRDEQDNRFQTFHIFESVPRYGLINNILFTDSVQGLMALEESRQIYSNYLGRGLDLILGIRDCPVKAMTLCVTSEPELIKCVKMRTALKAQLVKPEMACYKGHSHIHCMQAIKNRDADVAVFDAGDVYTAGLHYDLIPFISEVYDLGKPEFYVVAVAKEEDPETDLTYLKNKYTCHGGVNTGAGWVVPLAFLLSNGWMRGYGCDAMRAAAEYFGKSCVPGAISTEYNTGVPYDNMCHLCHGSSFNYCKRDASEDYYGPTGAFRCLVEGGGDVAFVRHTTVSENTGGKRREWWARNTLLTDFQLLCPNGIRKPVKDYRECNLGKVKANAIVTRGGEAYNNQEMKAYINLFIYAQQYYGRKDYDDFNFVMFSSTPPYSNLIFQDATTQLQVIKPSEREYSAYLGKDFMRAKRIVDCFASAPRTIAVTLSLLLPIATYFFNS